MLGCRRFRATSTIARVLGLVFSPVFVTCSLSLWRAAQCQGEICAFVAVVMASPHLLAIVARDLSDGDHCIKGGKFCARSTVRRQRMQRQRATGLQRPRPPPALDERAVQEFLR